MTSLPKKLAALLKTASDAHAQARNLVVGRRVRITASWSTARGRAYEVVDVCDEGLKLLRFGLPLSLSEVEFIESEQERKVREALEKGQTDMERVRQAQRGRRRA